MDGHPDNTLSKQIWSEKFAIGGRSQGGGFRVWRPYRVVDGTPQYLSNAELEGTPYQPSDAQYQNHSAEGGYHKWVKAQLSKGAPDLPEADVTQLVAQLCDDLKDRAVAVDEAVSHGQVGTLLTIPPNIYGASGAWESYSTPSRDARFKASFRGIFRYINDTVNRVAHGEHLGPNPTLEWAGSAQDLVQMYANIWSATASSCSIHYVKSNGVTQTLTLGEVEARLFDLSFDPGHCRELRWGANFHEPAMQSEFQSCSTKSPPFLQRYDDLRRNRNAIDREYGSDTPRTFGPEIPEDVNITNLLARLLN